MVDRGNLIIAEFSIVPIGQGSTSLSRWVAGALDAIGGVEGLQHELTPMGTILAARSMRTIFEAVEAAHEAMVEMGAGRVLSTLRIDDRRDKPRSVGDKVVSVGKHRKA